MPFVIKENPAQNAKQMAGLLRCPEYPSTALKECLKTKSAEMIVVHYLYFFKYSILPLAPFAPVVEKSTDAFIPDQPYVMLKQRKIYDKPWVCSTTTNEGIIITGSKIFLQREKNSDF